MDHSTPRCVRFGLKFAEQDTVIPNETVSHTPDSPSTLTRRCSVSSDDSSKEASRVQTPRGRSLNPEKKKGKRSQTPFARRRVNIYESDSDDDTPQHNASRKGCVRFAAPNSNAEKEAQIGASTQGQEIADVTGSSESSASGNSASSSNSSTAPHRGRPREISSKPARRSQTPFSHRRINLDDINDDEGPSEASCSADTNSSTMTLSNNRSGRRDSPNAPATSGEGSAGSHTSKPTSSTLNSIAVDNGSQKKEEGAPRRRVSFSQDNMLIGKDGKEPRKSRRSRLRVSFIENSKSRPTSRAGHHKDVNGTLPLVSTVSSGAVSRGPQSCSSGLSDSKDARKGACTRSSEGPGDVRDRNMITFEKAAVKKEGHSVGRKSVKFAESEVDREPQQRGRTMTRQKGKRSPTPFTRGKAWATESQNLDQWEEEGKGHDSVSENNNGDRKTVSFDLASLDRARLELYGEIETGGEDTVDEDQVCKTLPAVGRRGRSRTMGARGAIKRAPTPFPKRRINIDTYDCEAEEDAEPCLVKTVRGPGVERDTRGGRVSFGSRLSSLQTVNNCMTSEEEDSGFGGGEGKKKWKMSDVWRTMSRVTETTMHSFDSENVTLEKGTQTELERGDGHHVTHMVQVTMEAGVQTCSKGKALWSRFAGGGGIWITGFVVGFVRAVLES